MIDHADKNRRDHIVTIEDPVEFIHQSRQCWSTTARSPSHAPSRRPCARPSARTPTSSWSASTLHTVSGAKTVERILEVFPASEQGLIRNPLSTSLRLVLAQTLFRRVDGRGRVAAFEILVGTPAVANVLREGTT